MRKIPLTKGYYAIIDDDDYHVVSQYAWQVAEHRQDNLLRVYAVSNRWKCQIKMHRLIIKAKTGEFVDHINHDGLDNRKSNLRICSTRQNAFNMRKRPGTTSQYKGVCRIVGRKAKWQAMIRYNDRQYNLGRFMDEEDAAIAYNVAAQLFFGQFACLNEV